MATSEPVFTWNSAPPMPTVRVFATPIFHEEQLYILGGCDPTGSPVCSFDQYGGGKRWKRLAEMPTRRAGAAVAVVKNSIVAIGGVAHDQHPLAAVEIYDTVTKKWNALEPLGEALIGVSTAIRDGKILALGGMGKDTNPQDFFVEFDIEANKWKKLPGMPTPRYAISLFLFGDKLYALGGRQGKQACAALEVYDFNDKKWTKLPDIPTKRVFSGSTATETHIFIAGGLKTPASEGFSNECNVFDIAKGEWKTVAPMHVKRGDFAIGVINDRLVCAGGLGNDGKPMFDSESYCLETDTWRKEADMPSSHCSCAYIVHKNKLYVAGGLSMAGPSKNVDILQVK